MKTFGIITTILLVLAIFGWIVAGMFVPFSFVDYSDGQRTGVVSKISKKGLFCKTYEGYMLVSAGQVLAPESFEFTVKDENVVKALQSNADHTVTISYIQKLIASPCWGDTHYEIVNVQ